jgi:hypothetical protein
LIEIFKNKTVSQCIFFACKMYDSRSEIISASSSSSSDPNLSPEEDDDRQSQDTLFRERRRLSPRLRSRRRSSMNEAQLLELIHFCLLVHESNAEQRRLSRHINKKSSCCCCCSCTLMFWFIFIFVSVMLIIIALNHLYGIRGMYF